MAGADESHGIIVVGTGSVAVPADHVSLRVGVSRQGSSVTAERDFVAAKAKVIVECLSAHGVAMSDIRTSNLEVRSDYERPRGGPSHRVTTSVLVTIRELESVELIVDALFGEVGDGLFVQGLTFAPDDPAAGSEDALALAFAAAEAKAQHLAALSGLALGRVLAIREVDPVGQPRVGARAVAASAPADPIPIEPGLCQRDATISVWWETSEA